MQFVAVGHRLLRRVTDVDVFQGKPIPNRKTTVTKPSPRTTGASFGISLFNGEIFEP